MKLWTIFPVLLLAGLATAAPASSDSNKVVVTESFFPESLAVYTGEHDIVSIVVPLNALNFDDDADDDTDDDDEGTILFFVEADIKENGDRVDQGLYVLKNNKPKKLLNNGRDAAATNDDTKIVYFGAQDGIYVYNVKENSAEKYGSVTDSIIGIAKANGSDLIYILTEDKQLYKVTEEGNKKEKVDDVKNAQQIVLDYSNNLYYYAEDKQPYVVSADGTKKIQGLPENPSSVTLLRPAFVIDDGVPVVIDNKAYIIYANGSSELTDFELEVKPTAYGMEAALIQYYAYNKKIYEYNILAILLGGALDELKSFFTDKQDAIQSIATRSRSDLKA